MKEFGRLGEYNFCWRTGAQTEETPIEQLRSKNTLRSRLDSDLLPSINEQCSRLAGLPRDPPHVGQDPALYLKIIAEIQANLHQTLPQTIQTINALFPNPMPKPDNETNDQGFNEFKIYRLYHLDASIRTDLKDGLKSLFSEFHRILRDFKDGGHTSPCLIEFTGCKINQTIDWAISLSKASELSLIWTLWKNEIPECDEEFEGMLIQMGPTRLLDGEHEALLSPPAVELGTSLIPVFKLSRLFFNKLSQERVTKEDVASFTEMSSAQLSSLDGWIEQIFSSIASMHFSIKNADQDDPVNTSAAIIDELETLKALFRSYQLLIDKYILPNLFPNSLDLSSRVYFKDWLDSWTTSFSKAIHNTILAANTYKSSTISS
ncbi:uncharacterized protein PGTG_06137 [Puccinia graminis f. sp. tritici CRL 75-36-700-3]|uniref:Uncharacterized protein n=1 Tax=Puccinia graminis f. sp. tritici (strain CRL 75-36-700-3 / race SCCL) TaxID=418459 RepID=E3K7T2_PUCGT|nr:uncharacterized protein PGTG_06137 [Puccinia graminis f. sp. tritici CRL 75-36-700-3]EFP80181.1 hypothetical protein PGTG_06137 [Puccinia graminis f. sp. tritici CRL 75-36-700-3]